MSSDDKHIIDTVVLLYFLLVGEEDLLCTLLGTPLQVPLAVYDPEDRDLPPMARRRAELLSEMRQAVGHYESSARLTGDDDSLSRVRRIDSLHDEHRLVPVPMTPEERLLAAKLESAEALGYGVRVPLGPGEAACVAISFERGWTIATDDSDALKVLQKLHRGQDFRMSGTDLLIIARQVPTGFGGFIDLLALDAEGRVHVLELKRDRTPRDVVAQALDYGSWAKDLSLEEPEQIYLDYPLLLPPLRRRRL